MNIIYSKFLWGIIVSLFGVITLMIYSRKNKNYNFEEENHSLMFIVKPRKRFILKRYNYLFALGFFLIGSGITLIILHFI